MVEPRAFPDADGALGGSRVLDERLAAWLAEIRVADAAAGRRRTRSLRDQAAEDAGVRGLCVECAERGVAVTLAVGPTPVRGAVVGVGADFVAVAGGSGRLHLVRLSAVMAVRPDADAPALAGTTDGGLDVALDHLLGPLAADRPAVTITTVRGDVERGELRSAGADVVLLVDGTTPTWVPMGAIAALHLR